MEGLNNNLPIRLKEMPHFESDIDCEIWIDELIGILKNNPPEGINIAGKIEALEDAKELLNGQTPPRQKEIDTKFYGLVRDIAENEDQWGDLGVVFSDIWEYIRRKKAAENQ